MASRTSIILASLLALTATASAEPQAVLDGSVTDTTTGSVVSGALVYVSGPNGLAHTATTDARGHYAVPVEPGAYNVIFVLGRSRSSSNVTVGEAPATLDGKLDITSGEVIIIKEKLKPAVAPKPTNFVATKAPPYSDRAILGNAWTKAWLLLDVNPRGEVERLKFLKRPGYGLEEIARSEASKLHFEPGRDRDGKAVRTWVVWSIEWPSAWWLEAFQGTRSAMPAIMGYDRNGKAIRKDGLRGTVYYVPCAGSGPLNLDSPVAIYKDCSRPDLRAAIGQPWIAPAK